MLSPAQHSAWPFQEVADHLLCDRIGGRNDQMAKSKQKKSGGELLELAKETLIEITQAEAFAPIYVRLAYAPT